MHPVCGNNKKPEGTILKFLRSVKSVVCGKKAGSGALSTQGFKKSSSLEYLYSKSVSEVACSVLGLGEHIFAAHSLCCQKHTCKGGPVSCQTGNP